jgi:hypothetical protein
MPEITRSRRHLLLVLSEMKQHVIEVRLFFDALGGNQNRLRMLYIGGTYSERRRNVLS